MIKETYSPKYSEHEPIVPRHPDVLTLEQVARGTNKQVGGKARNVAELHHHDLPVPLSVAVSADPFLHYRQTGQIDPTLVRELERIRRIMGGRVALRSSEACEDGTVLSMSGVFVSIYLRDDTQTVEQALKTIFDQALSDEVHQYLVLHGKSVDQVQMGLLLQVLVESDLSGVLYTDVDGDTTLIQYCEGFGNQLVDGVTEGSSVVYSPTEQLIIKSKNTDLLQIPMEQVAELVNYATRIKAIFASLPQDVEFAIELLEVIILQTRKLTAEISDVNLEMSREDIIQYTRGKLRQVINQEKVDLGSDRVVLSDSNFSELLPKPKEMDFGVFAYIFTGSDGVPGAIQLGRQQMGYPLGDESVGFMYYIGGKPYFSVARDAHTFYAGFPSSRLEYNDTLVAEYLEQVTQDPSKGEYPEMGLYLQDPSLEDLVTRFGDKGQEYFGAYLQFKQRMVEHATAFMAGYLNQGKPQTDEFIAEMESINLMQLSRVELVEYATKVLEHLRTVSCVNFVKSARLGFYYSQRLQQLLQSEFGMTKDQADSTFSKLNQGLDGSEITLANFKIAQANSLEAAMEVGRNVVGHYSTGEMLEIRHPRLKDDVDALQQYVEGIFNSREQYFGEFEAQREERVVAQQALMATLNEDSVKVEFAQVMTAAQTYMSLRETVKYQFVKEYALLRDALVQLAHCTGIDEQEVFFLYPRELAVFAQNPASFKAVIAERAERFGKYDLLDLPPVIRESDLAILGEDNDESTSGNLELFGKLLAEGKALEEAIIVNIEDFETVAAAREVLLFYRHQALPIILVAAQMNLSHDPLIMQADGLVIENAGLVSHGAQRARELGRGAIGGIRARSLKTGEYVSFDPAARKVVRQHNGSGVK